MEEISIAIPKTILVTIEVATATIRDVSPKRKHSLDPSNVNGVPALKTFLKYLSAINANIASFSSVLISSCHLNSLLRV